MSDEPQLWSKNTIKQLTSDIHSKLRAFTETVLEHDEGTVIDDVDHDEYEALIHSQWALHRYLYPEEPS